MRVFAVVVCLLLSACSAHQSPRIVNSVPDGKGGFNSIVLSEYFESMATMFDDSLVAHVVVTLGDERLPEGYEKVLSWSDRKYQDHIEEVEEIYFTNLSDKEVTVSEVYLSYFQTERSLLSEPLVIPPKTFRKSDALVSISSVYRAPRRDRVLRVKANGVYEKVTLTEQRTPIKKK
ncbi:hypothetical protein [Gilvimarinus polysaccharolyticus]|uniref:hypothetical protein n=1 Tax=Gilvimarinus polysaccharolyticus TaxID=863921 RepID=UPI0006737DB7|nr:hypothetical protein [Gilvimarinus polysaccharolyticus]